MSVKSKVIAATGILLTLGLGLLMMPVLLLTVLGGDDSSTGCAPATPITYTGPNVGALTVTQMQRAAAVVDQGRRMGISDQGIVVALATASQESGFRVYANDGEGGDLEPDQKGIAASLDLPHDAVGTDHGSLGVFQQQWPWWGTMRELMDPAVSAQKFYEALLEIDAWESLPVTVAAQRVQRSAYPDAYADDEPLARELLVTIGSDPGQGPEPDPNPTTDVNTSGSTQIQLVNGVYVGGFTDCITAASAVAGDVAFPLPTDSGYVNQNNFGQSGGSWASFHTGNDYSVGCGTPVLAATGGTVQFDESQAGWAGPNFVRVSTGGSGSLATWYAHMETRTVSDGQTVTAGQQLGTVGDLGNSQGCHLHFEVHPQGGQIYDDPVDPVAWLEANLGRDLDTSTINVSSTTGDSSAVPVLSYNIKHGSIARASGGGLEAIAQEITASGAMIVALQEADGLGGDFGANARALAETLGMQFAYAVVGTWNGRELIDNAILTKYPIVEAGNTNLPGSEAIQPRGLLRVTVDLGEEVGLVDVYASHLHYTGDIRVTQAEAVRAEIGVPECPTVLMGDMNVTPGSEPHQVLATRLRDTFADGRFGPGNTSPVQTPKKRIDYVFHDQASQVVDAAVMPAGLSDHRAVRATLQVGASGDCA